jgi:methyl-accepting chemotaxis protein
MKRQQGMKISVKLIATFLVIALIAGGVGTYGALSLARVNDDSNITFSRYGNAQGYLGNIFGHFQMQRALLRDMMLQRNETAAAEVKKSLEASDKVMMDNLAAFKSTCFTEEEQTVYAGLSTSIEAFRGVRDALMQDGVNGNFDSAYEWILADSAVAGSGGDAGVADVVSTATETTGGTDTSADVTSQSTGEVDAAASATVSSNAKKAVENALSSSIARAQALLDEQNGRVKLTEVIMAGLSLAAVLLALALGIFISRSISKPLGEAALHLRKMAEGEDTEPISPRKFSGELKDIAISINAVRDSLTRLLEDSDMLTEAAVQGRLDARADATRHKGRYRHLIEGVNGTLDATVLPVQEAAAVLGGVAKGNLGVMVTGDYMGDHAIIKESLNGTISALQGYIGELTSVLNDMANGHMDVVITGDYRGDFEALKHSINNIASSLNRVLGEIGAAADQVAAGTRLVSDGSQEISQGATEQASAIEQLTASVSQIAEQTRSNAMSANKASELTSAAASEATLGNERMQAMEKAMDEINEASNSISKIIKVIDDIAFQTNILALNAAVEAARAGVHGKGFAVVAEEVRNLAARSASAAKETTELIEGSIGKTAAGTKIADDTAAALKTILDGVEAAAELVSEIAAASGEQATAIAQVDRGIEQMSQVVQTNSATSEEAAAAAEELSSQAEMLKNLVGQFKLSSAAGGAGLTALKPVAERGASQAPHIDLWDGDFGKY